ncbi:MAG TPA: DUF2848 family protein [Dehalococcoidia bacterium]|nr:DUF2848 family protein [Dehalococcoidia bacterium]
MKQLQVTIVERSGAETPTTLTIGEVLLAGYTGRNRASVIEHIRELDKLGIAPPPAVPMVYAVDSELLTTAAAIEVSGPDTSGEVEVCLVPLGKELLVGLGSDHTDRKQEAVDIGESKTLCQKPVSRTFWRYDDVRDHWDTIEIRSWAFAGATRQLYQEGTLHEFMCVDDLLDELKRLGHADLDGRYIFGGTIPTLGGLVCGGRFEAELRDPVLDRTLTCAYDVRRRPTVGGVNG